MSKGLVYLAITMGGAIGSYLPILLFHVSSLGAVSILGGVVGSILGVVVVYKMYA